jgi:hypothetical protein
MAQEYPKIIQKNRNIPRYRDIGAIVRQNPLWFGCYEK